MPAPSGVEAGVVGTGGVIRTGGTSSIGGSVAVPDAGVVGTGGLNRTGGLLATGGSVAVPDAGVVVPEAGVVGTGGALPGGGKNKAIPNCLDDQGNTRACDETCGDGNVSPGEACDDGNVIDGDGCGHDCAVEAGFACPTVAIADAQPCSSGTGQCLVLPLVYRDFEPENVVPGGHPDFYFLGSKWNGSATPTTICVPNSAGPGKDVGDATDRCWGIAGDTLFRGKPRIGGTRTCACQFSDWNIGNVSHIPGGYSGVGNDSPLSDGKGGYVGGVAGAAIRVTNASGTSSGTLVGFTSVEPVGPIFRGTVPVVKDGDSFHQWWNDDPKVNQTFQGRLELPSLAGNQYRYASPIRLKQGGFFPLDTLNPARKNQCNLSPYWNRGDGKPIWAVCSGEQYLFPPFVEQADCPFQNPISFGCWAMTVGEKHNFYFTSEARHHVVYHPGTGFFLQARTDGDLFVFINGQLVLDLGGTHAEVLGKVTITGDPGMASIVEGGCLDASGNLVGVQVGSTACSPRSGGPTPAKTPEDFRVRTVPLGLVPGKLYEVAIFHANRTPPESNLSLTLTGSNLNQSVCVRK